MVDNKVSGGGFRNRFVDYRRQVQATREFDTQLTKASTPANSSTTPAPSKTETQPSAQTNQMATQKAVVEQTMTTSITADDLPTGQLSPKITQYMSLIKNAAARHNLPQELIAGVIWQESRANSMAKSHCGAQGLMQLMPQTAANLGVTNAWDPAQNIEGGAKYIRQMLDKFGKLEHAVAAYNAGPGNVMKYNGIPPFRETQDYVPKVLGYAANFKASGLFNDSANTMRA